MRVHDEGCVCGHGAYNHPNAGVLGQLLGLRSNCIRCDCHKFRRVPPREVPVPSPNAASEGATDG